VVEQYLNGCGELVEKGQYQEALSGYAMVSKLSPSSFEARTGAAICHSYLNNWREAFENILLVLQTGGYRAKELKVLIEMLERSNLNSYIEPIERALIAALKHTKLEHPAIVLLSKQLRFKHEMLFSKTPNSFDGNVEAFLIDHTLCLILERQLNNSYLIEDVIYLSRKALLERAIAGENINRFIPFLSSLSCQMLLTDGLFFASKEEKALLETLVSTNSENIESLLIQICYMNTEDALCFWTNNQNAFKSDTLAQLNSDLEFYSTVMMSQNRGSIDNNLSKAVQSFYIENPYPKWKTTQVNEECSIAPIFQKRGKKTPNELTILSAGCGTGIQLVDLATSQPNATIIAIDLSPASIAYAQQMTQKYGINNIEFHLLDILKVAELGYTFDMIVCTGVLHHMQSPQDGLDALASVLSTDGAMHLAYYSTLARVELKQITQDITEFLAVDEQSITREGIRHWRSQLTKEQKQRAWYRNLDFFNLSGLFDLLFHPQQAEYSPLELEAMLTAAGMKFDWMNRKQNFHSVERKHPAPASGETMHYWDEIEKQTPDLFMGMISFYASKAV